MNTIRIEKKGNIIAELLAKGFRMSKKQLVNMILENLTQEDVLMYQGREMIPPKKPVIVKEEPIFPVGYEDEIIDEINTEEYDEDEEDDDNEIIDEINTEEYKEEYEEEEYEEEFEEDKEQHGKFSAKEIRVKELELEAIKAGFVDEKGIKEYVDFNLKHPTEKN